MEVQHPKPFVSEPDKQTLISKYNDYFSRQSPALIDSITDQCLQHHRIKIMGESSRVKGVLQDGHIYIQCNGSIQNGIVCQYQIFVGHFYLIVHVLNLQRNSEEEHSYHEHLGTGSYGIVSRVSLGDTKIAVKRINFEKGTKNQAFIPHLMCPDDYSDHFEIRKAIKEYSIYKICSMLEIGPRVLFSEAYDVICYNDCVQFSMELCERPEEVIKQFKNYEQDLKDCLYTLHSLKFVHKDIKPDNVLFSPSRNKFVLSDFGITHSVKEQIHEQSLTYYEGSYVYVCEEMKKLYATGKSGYVNLYFNDINAQQITIQQISESLSKGSEEGLKSYGENSLSWIAEGSQVYDSSETDYQEIGSENQLNTIYTHTSLSENATTSRTINTDLVRISGQINFYMMKTMYELFTASKTQEHNKHTDGNCEYSLFTEGQIKKVVEQCCRNCDDANVGNSVLALVVEYLIPDSDFEFLIIRLRNSIRMFGANSEETIRTLKQIVKSKQVPYNYNPQLQHMIAVLEAKRQSQVSMRNMNAVLLDAYRSFYLRNNRSAIQAIKLILRKCAYNMKQDYFESKNRNGSKNDGTQTAKVRIRDLRKEEKVILLVGSLMALTMSEISCRESQEIYRCLGYICLKIMHPDFNIYSTNSDAYQKQIIISLKNNRDLRPDQQVEIVQLVQSIVIQSMCKQKIQLGIYRVFAKAYIDLNKYDQAKEILRTVIAQRQKLEQLYNPNCRDQQSSLLNSQISEIVQLINWQIEYYVNLQINYGYCLELSKRAWSIITQFDNSAGEGKNCDNQTKIITLDRLVMLLVKNYYREDVHTQSYLAEAQQLNDLTFSIIQKQVFPKQSGPEYAYHYFHRATILIKSGKYLESVQFCKKSLSSLEEGIREQSHTLLIKSNMINIAHCYHKLGDHCSAFNYLESAYELSQVYHSRQPENTIHILENITFLLLQMGKCDAALKGYIDQLAFLKNHMLQSHRINTSETVRQQLVFYNLERLKTDNISEDSQIFIKKYIIVSIEPYLPTFLSFYSNLCAELAEYFMNQKKMINEGLKYMFCWFKSRFRQPKNSEYYRTADFYVSALMSANYCRRAIKFLRSYIFTIPEEFEKLRTEAFYKMHVLCKQLNTSEKSFYRYVWKLKPFASADNYRKTLLDLDTMCSLRHVDKILWVKKIEKMAPDAITTARPTST